jgi:general stress protein 26
MGEVQNLSRQESVKKIREIVEAATTGLFTTNLSEAPLSTRPMAIQRVDDDGTLWFFSEKDSNKNEHIEQDNRVQIFYCNQGSSEYLSLYGTATILEDTALAKELWKAIDKTWFNEGPEDPNLSIIKVEPLDAYYWDTKNGKVVSMLKIAIGAISGKELDGGIEGKLSI